MSTATLVRESPRLLRRQPVLTPPIPARQRTLRIGLLGCGTVGSCLARTLLAERSAIAARADFDPALETILVRHTRAGRGIPARLFTDSFEDVLRARPEVIIELLGGLDPAADFIRRALDAGISVITANKTVIAHHGPALADLARRRGVELLYEAAVCAAVPILSVLGQVRGDRVRSIHGIVNGSTNYVLSRMNSATLPLQDALVEAKSLGLIEPDPSADLSGRDSAEKLTILARAAGFEEIDSASIDIAGIEQVTPDDILAARRGGFTIKLVASLEREEGVRGGGAVSLRVGPTLVPRDHRLAAIEGARNSVVIETEMSGSIAVEGEGAGPRPTSAAIIGDLLRIGRLVRGGGLRLAGGEIEQRDADVDDDAAEVIEGGEGLARASSRAIGDCGSTIPKRHYLRVRVNGAQQPPAAIVSAFRSAGVCIKSIDARGDMVRIWTEPASTSAVRTAVRAIAQNDAWLIAPELAAADSCATTRSAAGDRVIVHPHSLVHVSRKRA